MALQKSQVKEILSMAGVDADHLTEAANKICEGHAASIEFLQEKVATLEASVKEKDSEIEKLNKASTELTDLKAKVAEEAKAREGKDYDKLKAEFDAYKDEIEKRDARAAKEKAFREVLKDAEIDEKYFDKIIKYSDVDGVKLTDDGKVDGAKDLIKSVKEEWPEYKVTTHETGAKTATPPANTGGTMTKEDILKIEDTTERQNAIAEHHELFGI